MSDCFFTDVQKYKSYGSQQRNALKKEKDTKLN